MAFDVNAPNIRHPSSSSSPSFPAPSQLLPSSFPPPSQLQSHHLRPMTRLVASAREALKDVPPELPTLQAPLQGHTCTDGREISIPPRRMPVSKPRSNWRRNMRRSLHKPRHVCRRRAGIAQWNAAAAPLEWGDDDGLSCSLHQLGVIMCHHYTSSLWRRVIGI